MLDKLSDVINHFIDFFWGIGFFGWHISTLYALYISYLHSWIYGLVYLFVFTTSGWVNRDVLKHYIHDPRPSNSIPFLANEHFRKKTNGMPSGHAQLTAFSLTFAYLISGMRYYESLLLFGITVIQRYVYHNHTMPQLLVGTIIGIALGYAVFYLLDIFEKKYLKKLNAYGNDNDNDYKNL